MDETCSQCALPEELPSEPMGTLKAWFDQAQSLAATPTPDAMTLATSKSGGAPTVRVVLCRGWNVSEGYIVFFTNYESRKGTAIKANPQAAASFFWDALHRQASVEGLVVRSPEEESDGYFQTRPLLSRLGAWASDQSRPLESHEALMAKVLEMSRRFGVALDAEDAQIPRPPQWGGFRLWARRVELWSRGEGRLHDRAVWTRSLTQHGDDAFQAGDWSHQRLQP